MGGWGGVGREVRGGVVEGRGGGREEEREEEGWGRRWVGWGGVEDGWVMRGGGG